MIQLSNIQPIPLQSLGINPHSEVFSTEARFEKGKHYLIKAPSGKGKSTLLHMMYGLRRDYEGQLRLAGQDSRSFALEDWTDWRRERLSIVFQDLRLFPTLTALENIQLKALLHNGMSTNRIQSLAERLGMASLLQRETASLSYGQQQRVAILRALSQPFEYLLLDEPFSHLDEANTTIALELMLERCSELQAGMILVSLGEDFPVDFERTLEL